MSIQKAWKSETTAKKYASLKKQFKYKELIDIADLRKGQKVIDLCCGTGLAFPSLRKGIGDKGGIIGVDFSQTMLNEAKLSASANNVKLVLVNAEDLSKVVKKKVDRVICNISMHHLQIQKVFKEVSKVLKEEGLFIFNLPKSFQVKDEDPRWILFNKVLHEEIQKIVVKEKIGIKLPSKKRKYTLKQMKEMLGRGGLELKEYFEKQRGIKPEYRLESWIRVPALGEQFLPGLDHFIRTRILQEAKEKVLQKIGTAPFYQTMPYFIVRKR